MPLNDSPLCGVERSERLDHEAIRRGRKSAAASSAARRTESPSESNDPTTSLSTAIPNSEPLAGRVVLDGRGRRGCDAMARG